MTMRTGLVWQQERPAGTEIGIGMVERCLVIGREAITDDDGGAPDAALFAVGRDI